MKQQFARHHETCPRIFKEGKRFALTRPKADAGRAVAFEGEEAKTGGGPVNVDADFQMRLGGC